MNSPSASPHPHEHHKSQRSGWLRAAVLGVNDGIVSNASLMLGVSEAAGSHRAVLTAGVAGLFAGAFSMAVGEYVSVSSQRDAERADIAIEERSLQANPEAELAELTAIYEGRGLDASLAAKVAEQLHAHDAVVAHARDERGIDHNALPNPLQAMLASALSFSFGSFIPIFAVLVVSNSIRGIAIVTLSLIALLISGAVSAYIGGGNKLRAAARVFVGGGIAMAITALIGHLIGASL
jgi:VIT1/CCC1 family predicted Fe2+/Mn2+ transporter